MFERWYEPGWDFTPDGKRFAMIKGAGAGQMHSGLEWFEEVRRLLAFLTEDCCGGRPELCGGPSVSRTRRREARV